MNRQLSELLPFYVNGTLRSKDRDWVDACLAADDYARHELAWYRGLQSHIAQSVNGVPEDLGLARTLQRIRADRATLGERIRGWLGLVGRTSIAALGRPIAAIAVIGIIGVQSGLIYVLARHADDDAQQIRALRAVPAGESPLLRVNFAPDAKEADIRLLLSAIEGRLVGGPGQFGDYYVQVPAGAENAAVNRLKHERVVSAVEIVAGLPTGY